MKKLFISIGFAALAIAGQACATMGGGSLPYVVASNAAMPYQILAAGQAVQPLYGGYGYGYGYGNVPVCRLQDLQGLPPVSQPVLVRVDKTGKHRAADIVGGCALGAGLGGLSGGAEGAIYGCTVGAGGGLAVANHEYDLCMYLPIAPAASQPPPPPAVPQPPVQPPAAQPPDQLPAAPMPGTRRAKL